MKTGPGKASVITGIAAILFLSLLAAASGVGVATDAGNGFYTLLGALAMLGWGAHIVGIGLGVEALRTRATDRRAGLAGLLINLASLGFWLALVPIALS